MTLFQQTSQKTLTAWTKNNFDRTSKGLAWLTLEAFINKNKRSL